MNDKDYSARIIWHPCPRCRLSFPWKRGEIPSHICPVCVGKEQERLLKEHAQ